MAQKYEVVVVVVVIVMKTVVALAISTRWGLDPFGRVAVVNDVHIILESLRNSSDM